MARITKPLLVLSVALVAAGGLSWLALRPPAPDPTIARPGAPAAAPGAPGARSAPLVEPAPSGATPLDASATGREAEPAAERRAAAPSEIDVVVLWSGQLEPASAAEVFVTAHGGGPVGDAELLFPFTGKSAAATAGADGRARIARPAPGSVVIARAGTGVGLALATPAASELRIVLVEQVLVRAVDASGAPLTGVPIVLRSTEGSSHGDRRLTSTVAPAGLARFARADVQGALRGKPDARWSFAARIASVEPIEVVLEAGALPIEPVELVLPPTGSIDVRLEEVDGSSYARPTDVLLVPLDASAPGRRDLSWSTPPGALRAPTELGHARFPWVALGLEFEAAASRGDGPDSKVRFHGPARAGERVSAGIRFGAGFPVLVARVVDEERKPLARAALRAQLEIELPFPMQRAQEVLADADGRIRIDVGREPARRLVLQTRDASGRVEVELPAELVDGANELGDLFLHSVPSLASGVVLDASDQPIADVRVGVYGRAQEPDDDGAFDWVDAELDVTTGEDGRFAIRGSAPAGGTIYVAATSGRHAPGGLEVAPGAQDLVLRLSAGGRIRGRLLCDPGFLPNDLRVSVALAGASAEGPEPPEWRRDRTWAQGDLSNFDLGPLGPGRYRLRVVTGPTAATVAEIEDLLVVDGETSADPRLDPLDLRGRVRVFRLTVLDPDHRPVPAGHVTGAPAGGVAGSEPANGADVLRAEIANGVARVIALHEAVDLSITATGFRTAVVQDVRGDREVVLERGLPVRLVLAAGVSLPEPPVFLTVRLVSESTGAESASDDLAFDEKRELALDAPAAGKLRVRWIAAKRGEDWAMSSSIADESDPVIEVRDEPGVQVFTVAPNAAKLAQAIAALGK